MSNALVEWFVCVFSGQTPVYAGYVPTPKSAPKAAPKPMGFAGLCRAHAMTSPEVQNFALLCRALSVLDPTTGEFLEHRQLRRDPKFKPVWDKSYANELQFCFLCFRNPNEIERMGHSSDSRHTDRYRQRHK